MRESHIEEWVMWVWECMTCSASSNLCDLRSDHVRRERVLRLVGALLDFN